MCYMMELGYATSHDAQIIGTNTTLVSPQLAPANNFLSICAILAVDSMEVGDLLLHIGFQVLSSSSIEVNPCNLSR